jgi:hypothetical protein
VWNDGRCFDTTALALGWAGSFILPVPENGIYSFYFESLIVGLECGCWCGQWNLLT